MALSTDSRKSLSGKQSSILSFIREFINDKDYPPSIRDIQDGCDISSTSVPDYNLKALERLGYIRRDPAARRALALLQPGGRRTRPLSVPVVGQIAAGLPIPVPSAEAFGAQDFEDAIEV